jgi:hypothetical protein
MQEDNQHILDCQNTIDSYPQILEEATLILEKELDKKWEKNIELQLKYSKPIATQIWEALEANTPEIFQKQTAKGIITQQLLDSFKDKIIKLINNQKPTSKETFINQDIMELAIAALTQSIYNNIWKPRTKYIFRENDKLRWKHEQEIKAQKKQQKKYKKQAKQEQAKRNPKMNLNLKRDIKNYKKQQKKTKRNQPDTQPTKQLPRRLHKRAKTIEVAPLPLTLFISDELTTAPLLINGIFKELSLPFNQCKQRIKRKSKPQYHYPPPKIPKLDHTPSGP